MFYLSSLLLSVFSEHGSGVQAADDPIAPKEAIPFKALEENPNCLLVLTPTGGHLGWCSGKDGTTGRRAPWLLAVALFLVPAFQNWHGCSGQYHVAAAATLGMTKWRYLMPDPRTAA